MYLERLSKAGIDSSPYYVPNGKFNTALPNSDIQMPNCTCYCYSRAFESVNAPQPFPIARTSLGYGNAKTWYEKSPLPKGKELKTGSIAVFDGNFGHVAFVERKIDSNHAVISQSQYDSDKSRRDYKYFEVREVELTVGKATLSGVGALIGFIYLPISDARTDRDKKKEQVQITEEMVNIRTTPNGSLLQKGCYLPMGFYDVKDQTTVDGYIWYNIGDGWVREGEWLKHFDKEDDLAEENERLKNELAIAYEQLDQIRKIVNATD